MNIQAGLGALRQRKYIEYPTKINRIEIEEIDKGLLKLLKSLRRWLGLKSRKIRLKLIAQCVIKEDRGIASVDQAIEPTTCSELVILTLPPRDAGDSCFTDQLLDQTT